MNSFITSAPATQSWGFELDDGRVVAVKVRPATARGAACLEAHRLAHAGGIDCPAPLTGREPLGEDPAMVVTAETWRADGTIWPTDDPASNYGRLLARLVVAWEPLDPTRFAPPPAWLQYDHTAPGRLWPAPAIQRLDPERINHELPAGLTRLVEAARERLLAADLAEVVGHCRLSGRTVRWLDGPGGRPEPVVHSWDELAGRPEAVLAGCLAASYYELPDESRIAPVPQGMLVLAAYQETSGRDLSAEELQVAWAASIWVAGYRAALEHLAGAPGQATHQIVTDGAVRLRLAGC